MNNTVLAKYIKKSEWGKKDFRSIKDQFILDVQKGLLRFTPLQRESYEENEIQVLDFFCGAGGTSSGFSAINTVVPSIKMLGGCDINKVSAETYSHNYDTPVINMDIRILAHDQEKLDDLLNRIGYDSMKPLVLIGCAPCQGFTSHRKKHWGEGEDERNDLVLSFARIVEKLQPDAILMENVPEFLSKKYWQYFSEAKSVFEREGYIVKQQIYNAASFGVPQERFRSIVIAMKKQFILPSGNYAPEDYRTVRDAIGHLPKVNAGIQDPTDKLHKSVSHKQSTIDVIKQVPHDGGNRPAGVGPKCLDKTKGFSDTYGRLYWDKPSITITHYARNPASGRYTHPDQDRGLTAREAALLQSFPNGFEFTGKSDDIYRQIGEAVPPMLSAAVATSIIIELLSPEPTEEQLKNAPSPVLEPVSSSYSSVIAGIKIREKVG